MAQLRRRRSKLSKVELARASGQAGGADPLPAANIEFLSPSGTVPEGSAPVTGSVAKPDDLEVLEQAALSLWSEGRRNEALTILESRIAIEKGEESTPAEVKALLRVVPAVVAAGPSVPAIAVPGDRSRGSGGPRRRTWMTGLAAGLALVFVPGAVLWADGRLPRIDAAEDAQQAPASLAKPLRDAAPAQARSDAGAVRQAAMLPAVQAPAKEAAAASHPDVMAVLQATWQNLRSSELADHWSALGRQPDPAQVLDRTKSALQPLQDAGRAAWLALAASTPLPAVYALSLGIGSMDVPSEATRNVAVALQEPAAEEPATAGDEPVATPRPPKPRPAAPQAAKPKVRATQQAQATGSTRLDRNRAAAQRYAAAQPDDAVVGQPIYADAQPYVPPAPVYYYYAPRPVYGWPRGRGFVWFRRADGW